MLGILGPFGDDFPWQPGADTRSACGSPVVRP